MKKYIVSICVCYLFAQVSVQSQTFGWDQTIIQFKDTLGQHNYNIDNIVGEQNIWQQAFPSKPVIGSPSIQDSVMITLGDTAYPTDNHSSFTVPMNINCDPCVHLLLIGKYWCHTDSLLDFGGILFSPDNGQQWIDLINDTSIVPLSMWKYNAPEPYRPTLTGNSDGWTYFEVDLVSLLEAYDVHVDDSVLFRFTFTSDANHTGHDGLAYDYLRFDQQYLFTNIQEKEMEALRIYPNPANDILTLENPSAEQNFIIEIFDLQGRRVMRDKLQPGRNKIDVVEYPSGTYIYRLFSTDGQDNKTGKFSISHY